MSGGTFTITGGRLEARDLAGTLGHTGTLTLARGERSLTLFDLGVAVPALTAQVWDFRAPVATLAGVSMTVRGRRAELLTQAVLTEVAARELNEAFDTAEFTAGMPLGDVTVRGRLRG